MQTLLPFLLNADIWMASVTFGGSTLYRSSLHVAVEVPVWIENTATARRCGWAA